MAVVFFTTRSSGDDSSGLDRLDPLFVGSLAGAGSSGLGSLAAGRVGPRLVSFFTAGVLGFLAGAPFLTGVGLGGGADSFLDTGCFLPVVLAGDSTFLAGVFFARARPLPFAFD